MVALWYAQQEGENPGWTKVIFVWSLYFFQVIQSKKMHVLANWRLNCRQHLHTGGAAGFIYFFDPDDAMQQDAGT